MWRLVAEFRVELGNRVRSCDSPDSSRMTKWELSSAWGFDGAQIVLRTAFLRLSSFSPSRASGQARRWRRWDDAGSPRCYLNPAVLHSDSPRRTQSRRTDMPYYERDKVRIHYEEAGSGFPLLVMPGGGLNSRISMWQTAPFNAMEVFKNDFRVITMDQRNALEGESTGPVQVDDPWGAFADDQIGLMDHL